MSEGMIPINAEDLPIDSVPMEESSVYNGYLRKATISPKLSKKDVLYCALQLEVADGDYEGRTVMLNYLPLPVGISPDASKAQRIKIQEQNQAFGRFVKAFKISGRIPSVSLSNPDSLTAWQAWIEPFYDKVGKFTIRNQEFPEGSGRLRSSVSDFVF